MIDPLKRHARRILAAATLVFGGLSAALLTTAPSKAYTEQFGVYGTRWADWVQYNSHLAGFYIYQIPRRTSAEDSETLNRITATGIEIIGMQVIHPSVNERFMRNGGKSDRPVSEVVDQIASHFADPAFNTIIDVSIDEENFWWWGRDRYLTDIYYGLKQRLPGRNFYQWFNDNQRRRAPVNDRYSIPADGYISDMYSVPLNEYEERVRGYVQQGKPVIATLWASANWKHGSRKEGRLPDWWDREGWRIFLTKAMINRRYGVRMAMFMYDLPYTGEGRALTPSFKSEDPCARAFTKKLFTQTLPTLGTLPLDTPIPTIRPDWMAERCPPY